MCDAAHGHTLIRDVCGVVRHHEPKQHIWDGRESEWLRRGVLVVNNLIRGMQELATSLQQAFSAVLPDSAATTERMPHSRPFDNAKIAEFGKSAGAVLVGLGNCGACTTWLCDLADIFAPYLPVAILATPEFSSLASERLAVLGQGSLPIITTPAVLLTTDQPAPAEAVDDIVEQCLAAWGLRGTTS